MHWLWHSKYYRLLGDLLNSLYLCFGLLWLSNYLRLLGDLLCRLHLCLRLFFLNPLPCSRLLLLEAFPGPRGLLLSQRPLGPLPLELFLQTLLIVLHPLDCLLLLLHDPLLLLALTHLYDPLHQLLLLLVDLLLLLLLLPQTRLHRLPHQLLLRPLLRLYHLPGHHRPRLTPSGCRRLLAGCLGHLRRRSGMQGLTQVLSHGHLQGHLVQLCVALHH